MKLSPNYGFKVEERSTGQRDRQLMSFAGAVTCSRISVRREIKVILSVRAGLRRYSLALPLPLRAEGRLIE